MEQILLAYGIPKETVAAITILYWNTKVKVRSPDGDTEYFDIVAGVLQGDTLAPYLFIICLDYVHYHLSLIIISMIINCFRINLRIFTSFPFFLISSILEYVVVVCIEWVGFVISFLFPEAIQASIPFEARWPTDLSTIRLSGAWKSQLVPWHLSSNNQLPSSNHNFSNCFSRNWSWLGRRWVSSRPYNLMSMRVD